MRSLTDQYAYANPLLEPVSLDGPSASGKDARDAALALRDESCDPEQQIELAQTRHAIRKWMAKLSARDRDLLERLFWEDEMQADVARAMCVSRSAISQQMTRITKRGRSELKPLRDSLVLH